MLKILLMLLGAAVGAAGSTSWLLSESPALDSPAIHRSPDSIQARWTVLQARVRQALADGERAKEDTESRLRRELDAYRKGARLPSA